MLGRYRAFGRKHPCLKIVSDAMLIASVTILILIFLGVIPFYREICETTQKGQEQCSSENIAFFAVGNIGSFIDLHNWVILAFATIAIAWFTYSLRQSTEKLWKAGERQLELARAEFGATHRAKLEVRFVRKIETGVQITVINTGTGAAEFIGGKACIKRLFVEADAPSPHEIDGDRFTLRKIFGPSDSDTCTINELMPDPPPLNPEPCYIFGWIVYETISPAPIRRTTYFGRRTKDGAPDMVPLQGGDWNFLQ